MLQILVELNLLRKIIHTAVHTNTNISGTSGILKHLRVFALSGTNHRRKNLHARSFRELFDQINDLIHSLLAYFFTALWAVRNADSRPQKTEIIIYFRDCSDG